MFMDHPVRPTNAFSPPKEVGFFIARLERAGLGGAFKKHLCFCVADGRTCVVFCGGRRAVKTLIGVVSLVYFFLYPEMPRAASITGGRLIHPLYPASQEQPLCSLSKGKGRNTHTTHHHHIPHHTHNTLRAHVFSQRDTCDDL